MALQVGQIHLHGFKDEIQSQLGHPGFFIRTEALKDIGYGGVFSLETLPASKLPDDLFEEAGLTLAKIARLITADI